MRPDVVLLQCCSVAVLRVSMWTLNSVCASCFGLLLAQHHNDDDDADDILYNANVLLTPLDEDNNCNGN